MWHQSKLTKKQLKFSKYKLKVPSSEQGGKLVLKHRLLKSTHSLLRNASASAGVHAVVRRSSKRLWFLDTAAPIPGVGFIKKRKWLQSTKQRAFKTIQSWLGIYNKKQMKFLANSSANMFCIIESMFQSSFRKRAFAYNAQQSNALLSTTLINGNYVKKHRFVNSRADQSTIPTASTKVQSYYATKKILDFSSKT